MRIASWCVILLFVCCGLFLATGGIRAQTSSGGEGLFIPTVDESWRTEANSVQWKAAPRSGEIKSRRATEASRPSTEAESATAETGGARLAVPVQLPEPWIIWGVALGSLIVITVPVGLLLRRIAAGRVRRKSASSTGARGRASVPSMLAASLIQAQTRDLYAEKEQLKKTRRAA